MKRRKFTQKPYAVPQYIADSLRQLKPPDDLTVSEWAERYRVLDIKSSSMPGQWRNSVTPYLVGIMDAFSDVDIEEIVFVKPTQVGGTEAMQNMLGYIIAQDPAPTMIVYPTDELGETTSVNRLQPMFRESPQLCERFHPRESTKTELQFDGMYVSIAGANSPSGLASKPIKYLLLDEVDKYPFAGKREADAVSLAEERTKTFRGRKIYKTSTPTLRTGHIWKMKESCDVEKHFFCPCPNCGAYIELKFSNLRWPGKETGMNCGERAKQAVYVCQECGGIITDAHKAAMLQKGQWRDVRISSPSPHSVAFWMSTLYSPFTSFSEIAGEFLKCKNDPDKLHNFANSWLAEPWEDTKLKTSAETVLERQTDLPQFTVPDWTVFLTGGVDVQENCLYWSIRAWGENMTSQNIAHGQALCGAEVEQVMNLPYKTVDGTEYVVELALVDSGDQTDDVYDFCLRNIEWAVPCKGTGNMLNHYKISTVNKENSRANGMRLVLLDGGKYKDMIAARMRKPNGNGSWMVHAECDLEYCEQVTAEHKISVRDKSGRESQRWVPKTSHADNHYLDTEVYAACAADLLGVRTLFLRAQSQEDAAEQPQAPIIAESDWIQNNEGWLG